MRRFVLGLALAGLAILPFASSAAAVTPPASPVTVSLVTTGFPALLVKAPREAHAWRVRFGNAQRALQVVVVRRGSHWTGRIQWLRHTAKGLVVERTLDITHYLGRTSHVIGACDSALGLCAVSLGIHLPTRTYPAFKFGVSSLTGSTTGFVAVGSIEVWRHHHLVWINSAPLPL